jgi:hypothetical protein
MYETKVVYTHVTTSYFRTCKSLTDECISYMIFCTDIEIININGSANISDAAIDSLHGLTNLKSLSISQCPRITSSGIVRLLRSPGMELQALNVSCNPSVDLKVMEAVIKQKSLASLNMANCTNISGADAIILLKKEGARFTMLNLENNAKIGYQTMNDLRNFVGPNVLSSTIKQ